MTSVLHSTLNISQKPPTIPASQFNNINGVVRAAPKSKNKVRIDCPPCLRGNWPTDPSAPFGIRFALNLHSSAEKHNARFQLLCNYALWKNTLWGVHAIIAFSHSVYACFVTGGERNQHRSPARVANDPCH